MKTHIKTGIKIIGGLALIGGIYFAQHYMITRQVAKQMAEIEKYRASIVAIAQRSDLMAKFLVETFPEETKAFDERLPEQPKTEK